MTKQITIEPSAPYTGPITQRNVDAAFPDEAPCSASIDTDYQANVTCPHCGYVDQDSWEIDFGDSSDGETDVDCGNCGETFVATRIVTVDYSTHKKPNAPVVLKPCPKCGGEAKVCGTPGYLIVRCQVCLKSGWHVSNTSKGRKKAIREWNKGAPPNNGRAGEPQKGSA